MAIREYHPFDPDTDTKENQMFIAHASYDKLFLLFGHVIRPSVYKKNPYYEKLSYESEDDFYSISEQLRKIKNVFSNLRAGYKNTILERVLKKFIYENSYSFSHDKQNRYLNVIWNHKYNGSISIKICKYYRYPVIDIILNTLCTRLTDILSAVKKISTDIDTEEKIIPIKILSNALHVLESALKKFQKYHADNRKAEEVERYVNSIYHYKKSLIKKPLCNEIHTEIEDGEIDEGKNVISTKASTKASTQPSTQPSSTASTQPSSKASTQPSSNMDLDKPAKTTSDTSLAPQQFMSKQTDNISTIKEKLKLVVMFTIQENKLVRKGLLLNDLNMNLIDANTLSTTNENNNSDLIFMLCVTSNKNNVSVEKILINRSTVNEIKNAPVEKFGLCIIPQLHIQNQQTFYSTVLVDMGCYNQIKTDFKYMYSIVSVAFVINNEISFFDVLILSAVLNDIRSDTKNIFPLCEKKIIIAKNIGSAEIPDYDFTQITALVANPIDSNFRQLDKIISTDPFCVESTLTDKKTYSLIVGDI